ncbi:MAG: hypothetical protein BGO98_00880 [Myxococcales bacterium 68-20]|nr:MAG: hypothetical protein BGO98_00880 [Myxococcales bacterium 68-20]
MFRFSSLGLVSLLLVTGCPPGEKPSPSSSSSSSPNLVAGQGKCTKVGQSCEVSPGKLGTCVQKDDCPDPGGCFVCQSQH